MSDPTTPAKGLTQPTVSADDNVWGDPRSSLTHQIIVSTRTPRPASATPLHRIAVQSEGLGNRLDQMTAWLTRIAARAWAGA